jgi:hypothetical protein
MSWARSVGLAVERRVAEGVRRARGLPAIARDRVTLRTEQGIQIEACVHRAAAAGREGPAVLLCPGIDDAGTVFDSWRAPISADEVAALGAIVLHFDPAGRGRSWGEEDYGGNEHQEDVAVAFEHLAGLDGVDARRIGVVAISHGSAMAIGALARRSLGARWIIDWEGPSDREIMTGGGAHMAPAAGHALGDDAYWAPREPVRHVDRLPCAYVRLQANPDHAQPGETRHATRMIQAAASGALPWFQINDHPRNESPPRPNWLAPGTLAANRALLRKIRTLMDTER